MKKLGLVFAVVAAIAAFFILDIDQLLTLDSIKSSQAQFEAWRSASPILVSSVFLAIYGWVDMY